MGKKKSNSKSQTLASPSPLSKPQPQPKPTPSPLKPTKKSKSKSKTPKSSSKKEKKSKKSKSKKSKKSKSETLDYDSESTLTPIGKLHKLLKPYTKDHFITLLTTISLTHQSLLNQIQLAANTNICHRRLFVHGIDYSVSDEDLRELFGEYGEVEDCSIVVDRSTGEKKGYGFVRFRNREGAVKALKVPVKRVKNGTSLQCVLASVGTGGMGLGTGSVEGMTRKIYVGHVPQDADAKRLLDFFSTFGEIEAGPMGFDFKTGKSRGFAIFQYRTFEGARKALEEPLKIFEGHQLYCKKHEESKKKEAMISTASTSAPQQMLPQKTREASSPFAQSMPPKTVQDVLPPQSLQAQAGPFDAGQGLPPGISQLGPQQVMSGAAHVHPTPSHGVHPPPHLLAAVAAAQNLAMYSHNPSLTTSYGGMLGAPSNLAYYPGRVDERMGGAGYGSSYGASQGLGFSGGYGDPRNGGYGDPRNGGYGDPRNGGYGSYGASIQPSDQQTSYPKDQLGKSAGTGIGSSGYPPRAR